MALALLSRTFSPKSRIMRILMLFLSSFWPILCLFGHHDSLQCYLNHFLSFSFSLSSNSFPNGQCGHMTERLTAPRVVRAGQVTLASMMTAQKYRGEVRLQICPVNTPNTPKLLRAFSIHIREMIKTGHMRWEVKSRLKHKWITE